MEAVGPEVTEVAPGDRVAYAMARGSYAEYAVVPAGDAGEDSRRRGFQTAAAAMLQGMTAHYLTHSTYPLEERRYLPGACRGRRRGRPDRADGEDARGARVRHGLDGGEGRASRASTASTKRSSTRSRISRRKSKRLTGGRGVDVVYDSVGKTTFDKSLNSLRPRGTLALFGQSSGPVPPFDPNILNGKGSLYLTRPSLGHYVLTREELLWRAGRRA